MVDEDPEVIKSRMEETRNSLVEKVETLERQVSQTVQEATNVVSTTVESVKDAVDTTVGSVKEVVGSTVDSVKDAVDTTTEAVQSTFDTVKQTFDVAGHVQRSPWLMMGGAVLTGFVAGKMIESAGPHGRSSSYTPSSLAETGFSSPRAESGGNGRHSNEPAQSSGPGLLSLFEKPLGLVQGMAVSALFSVVRDLVKQSLPPDWGKQLTGVVEDLNRQFGGSSLLPEKKADDSSHNQGDHHAERHGTKMAGSVGAADRQGQESLGPVHRR